MSAQQTEKKIVLDLRMSAPPRGPVTVRTTLKEQRNPNISYRNTFSSVVFASFSCKLQGSQAKVTALGKALNSPVRCAKTGVLSQHPKFQKTTNQTFSNFETTSSLYSIFMCVVEVSYSPSAKRRKVVCQNGPLHYTPLYTFQMSRTP